MSANIAPRRGQIWKADFEPVVGHEQGRQRPCLVISDDLFNAGRADLVIVILISSVQRAIRSHVSIEAPEGGLTAPSDIMCEHIRTISKVRLIDRWGQVSPSTMQQVETRIKAILTLS